LEKKTREARKLENTHLMKAGNLKRGKWILDVLTAKRSQRIGAANPKLRNR